jgi:hypothetical protein
MGTDMHIFISLTLANTFKSLAVARLPENNQFQVSLLIGSKHRRMVIPECPDAKIIRGADV